MRLFLISALAILLSSCGIQKVKNIDYLPETLTSEKSQPKLNIFAPKEKPSEKMPVIIFAHGGNWNRGSKAGYGFYGRDLARKNIVLVVPGYTLSPEVTYDTQAKQIAEAIKWTKANISDYGGDPNNIFVNGHSAGGHLAALAVMNPKYGINQNEISGLILNDAAGLDIYSFNLEVPPKKGGFYDYVSTFTDDPEIWKDASPINFVSEDNPPFLIMGGTKSIKSIIKYTDLFVEEVRKVQPEVNYTKFEKGHFSMMLHMIYGGQSIYKVIEDFIEVQRK